MINKKKRKKERKKIFKNKKEKMELNVKKRQNKNGGLQTEKIKQKANVINVKRKLELIQKT